MLPDLNFFNLIKLKKLFKKRQYITINNNGRTKNSKSEMPKM